MLNAPTRMPGAVAEVQSDSLRQRTSILQLLNIIRRRRGTIILMTAGALSLAVCYLLIAAPQYTAAARLITDTRRSHSGPTQPDAPTDPTVIESQIETIKSERLALAVINKLDLQKDPEFNRTPMFSSMLGGLRTKAPDRDEPRGVAERRTIDQFARALKVVQIGRSYVADVRFTSTDPEKAARVANALADSYIDDQLEARTMTATRAALWLEVRINELRRQANEATRALDAFKLRIGDNRERGTDGNEEMRALEAAVDSYKRSYEVFQNLARYSQTAQQQSVPVTEARILSPALPPVEATSPRVGLILFLSMLTGCGLGVAAAFTREYLDRSVRSPLQLEQDLGIRYLGALPLLSGRHFITHKRGLPLLPSLRLLGKSDHGIPLFDPGGLGWETLVSFQFGILGGDEPSHHSIGIISARTGEGKTTVAFNLAHAMASSGKRVLLIDADLRNPSLSRVLATRSDRGLLDAINGTLAPNDISQHDKYGFWFLPNLPGHNPKSPPDMLSSAGMRDLLNGTKAAYDCIVIDLPSALDYIDVRAITNLLDGVVLVSEWGRTKMDDLENIVMRFPRLMERLAGAFINKVGSDYTDR
jgi:polysaccharide biosynthesis transport protein